MDECYIQEYEISILDVFADKGGNPIGYISFAAARKVNEHSLDLSWCPNVFTRFHEMAISLPKDKFVTCVGSWRYDEKPYIFVKSGWLEQLHLKSYTVFFLVDAIGVKAALQNGTLSRDKLVLLREAIDRLADSYSEVCFVSFADSLLIKSNWTGGHFRSDVSYTYYPEVFVRIIKEIKSAYREALGLDVYAILTQGTNEYYRGGPSWLDRMFHSLSGASQWSDYAAVSRAVRLSQYTFSGVFPSSAWCGLVWL